MQTDRQTDRLTDILQAGRQTDRLTDMLQADVIQTSCRQIR